MKLSLILLSLIVVFGCANPYKAQFEALQTSFNNGEISANDYFSRLNELQALDLQRRQNLAQAFSQAGYHLGNAANKINQPNEYLVPTQTPPVVWISRERQYPRSGSGTLTTPSGKSYNYNYREDLSN
jgi:hypothetical protein